jgi:hypothetical protein
MFVITVDSVEGYARHCSLSEIHFIIIFDSHYPGKLDRVLKLYGAKQVSKINVSKADKYRKKKRLAKEILFLK